MSPPSGMDRLLGEWDTAGTMDVDGRTITITGHTTIEPLGEFVVLRTTVQPAEFPDSVSIIGGGPADAPAPMHYFDERGVQRLYLSTVDEARWVIQLADADRAMSPGFDQRYVGEISPTGRGSPAPGSAASVRPAIDGRSTSRSTSSASADIGATAGPPSSRPRRTARIVPRASHAGGRAARRAPVRCRSRARRAPHRG